MRRLMCILMLLLAATLSVTADEKADVLKIDQQFVEARVAGDGKLLGALLCDSFTAVTHKGQVLDKAEFLKYHSQRDLTKMTAVPDSFQVKFNGNTAVVTGHVQVVGTDQKDGKFDQKDSVVTRVWVKDKSGWKLFSVHWHML